MERAGGLEVRADGEDPAHGLERGPVVAVGREALQAMNGRGGGSARLFQGSGRVDDLAAGLDLARIRVIDAVGRA